MNANNKVVVLLSTYNGERYLSEFLDSLLAQTHQNWCLNVRDDGSQDNTRSILKAYRDSNEERIRNLDFSHAEVPVGPVQSFARLMKGSAGQYFMFADQDDIWSHRKIELSLARMQVQEKICSPQTPILVHSDLAVVDCHQRMIAPSFMAYRNLDPLRNKTCQLLVQNVVTGCTTCFNRSLKELAQDIPDAVIMHDWWLALVASCFGVIEFIDQPTVNYRQHGQNLVGARFSAGAWSPDMMGKLKKMRAGIVQASNQAWLFLNHFESQLSPKQKKLLHAFATIRTKAFVERHLLLARYGIAYNTIVRNLGLWLTI